MSWSRVLLPVALLAVGCGEQPAPAPAVDEAVPVTVRTARRGQHAQVGMVAATVAPLPEGISGADQSHLRFGLSEPEFYRLYGARAAAAEGVAVRVFLSAEGPQIASGKIVACGAGVDAASGVVQMRAVVTGGTAELTLGRQVRLEIAGLPVTAYLVPLGALMETPRGQILLVCVDGKAERRLVALGDLHGVQQVILAGLTEGDQVIINPPRRLRHGMAVQAIADDSVGR